MAYEVGDRVQICYDQFFVPSKDGKCYDGPGTITELQFPYYLVRSDNPDHYNKNLLFSEHELEPFGEILETNEDQLRKYVDFLNQRDEIMNKLEKLRKEIGFNV